MRQARPADAGGQGFVPKRSFAELFAAAAGQRCACDPMNCHSQVLLSLADQFVLVLACTVHAVMPFVQCISGDPVMRMTPQAGEG